MKTLLKLLLLVLSCWLSVIGGMELQARRQREIGAAVPWAVHYDEKMWIEVVESMQASRDNDLRLASIVAREGYRLGVASGEAFCMAAGVRNGLD